MKGYATAHNNRYDDQNLQIAAIPGDGIGQEVITAG